MKHPFTTILMIFSLLLTGGGVTACNPDDDSGSGIEIPSFPDNSGDNNNNGNSGHNNENNTNMQIQVKINGTIYTATLAGNNTAAAFKAMLPLTLNMSDVNRNEKFIQLPAPLPTAATNPGTIRTGDIMLYESAGLVLFYKSFTTSYSYTRIGAIDNPTGLEILVGTGNVTVTFKALTP
ncbi:MAG: hypothetical protein LIP06_16455 [Tannerellaceae bacterium]|nr:hypothetical protein [Tannerellaceae bacterium]